MSNYEVNNRKEYTHQKYLPGKLRFVYSTLQLQTCFEYLTAIFIEGIKVWIIFQSWDGLHKCMTNTWHTSGHTHTHTCRLTHMVKSRALLLNEKCYMHSQVHTPECTLPSVSMKFTIGFGWITAKSGSVHLEVNVTFNNIHCLFFKTLLISLSEKKFEMKDHLSYQHT